MSSNELSVLLTARGNLQTELSGARDKVKELSKQIKEINASGGSVGDDLAEEFRTATQAADKLSNKLSEVNRDVKRTASESSSAAAKVGRAWQKAASVFNNDLVAGLSAASLLMFGKKAVNTFSQVEDASSALSATFGANGDALIKWAKQSGDALNLSQTEALSAAQTFAIFAESAGLGGQQMQTFTTDLTARAADLASYFGGSTADAVTALGSALRGEAEPARRYGILLDDMTLKAEAMAQGIYNGNGPLTQQQKILAAQTIIMKQSARAAGDVERTQDSMANQIKDSQQQMADFQATAGETIAVGLRPMLKLVNGAAKGFSQLPDPLKQVSIGIGLIGTAALIATPRIMALKTQLQTSGVLASGWGKNGLKAAGGILAVTAAMTAMNAVASDDNIEGRYFDDMGTALRNIVQPGWYGTVNNAAGVLRKAFLPFWSTDLEESKAAMQRLDTQLVELYANGQTAEAKQLFENLVSGAKDWGGSIDDVKAQVPGYTKAMESAADATAETGTAAEDAAAKINPLTRAMRRFGHALDVKNALSSWKKAFADNVKKPSQETAVAAAESFMNTVGTYKEGGRAQARFVADNYAKMKSTIENSSLSDAMQANLLDPLNQAKAEADNVLAALKLISSQPVNVTYTTSGLPSYAQPGWVNPIRKAVGGLVTGPGSATSDSIPALLSNGEYVIRAAAARRLGIGTLNSLNRADKIADPALMARLSDREAVGAPLVGALHVQITNPAKEIDVEKALMRGMARAARIERERGSNG